MDFLKKKALDTIKGVIKQKPTPPDPPEGKLIITLPCHSNFKGFKRIRLSAFCYEPAEKGINNISLIYPDLNFVGVPITLRVLPNPSDSEYSNCIWVYIDDYYVGTVFSNSFENYQALLDGKIEKLYIKFDTEKKEKNNKKTDFNQPYLLVKI